MRSEHIIKKQVLDVTLDSEEGSFTLQSRLGRICETDIVPVIDRYCSRLSEAGRVHRIDRLEVDLGVIDPRRLDVGFRVRMEEVFPEILEQALHDRAVLSGIASRHEEDSLPWEQPDDLPVTPADHGFDLLDHFMKKGRLPWWAGQNERVDITALMESQIRENPEKVRGLLSEILADPVLIKRLVHQFDDSVLEKILAQMVGDPRLFKGGGGSLFELYRVCSDCLKASFPNGTGREERLRAELLSSILHFYGGGPWDADLPQLVSRIATQVSPVFQLGYEAVASSLATGVRQKGYTIPDQSGFRGEQQGAAGVKTVGTHTRATGFRKAFQSMHAGGVEGLFDRLHAQLAFIGETDGALQNKAVEENVSGLLKAVGESRDQQWESGIPDTVSASLESLAEVIGIEFEVARRVRAFPEPFPAQGSAGTKGKVMTRVLNSFAQIKDRIRKKLAGGESNMSRPGPERTAGVGRFSDSEELFVNNAGIVLFWPYLKKLFESSHLMDRGSFQDEEKRDRAIAMLRHLSHGRGESPEYDLVLNKILCGVDPDTPVHSRCCLTDEETGECDLLLHAVIQNWGVLKKISAEGFRQMFLIREGVIRQRDGNRVLRIEEKAHDILVDKLPWSISTLKLPWMVEPLFVEWRL